MLHVRLCGALATLLLMVPCLSAAPPGVEFFEQKIRPVLVKYCYDCHSQGAKKVRGGLLLDTREGLLKGGDSGPALVPGKPVESLLLKALRHDELAMPPKEKLADAVIADFEKWIRLGAPDPRTGSKPTQAAGIDLETGRKFWAFQPPRQHPLPAVSNTAWPRGPLDHFILAGLEAKKLSPGRDADRVTLIRRLTLDLIGLRPTPEEVEAFVGDTRPDALARVVDRLLASPHFGERWGRHWLDVARYADSNGKDENLTFHEAWKYRDYVIRSFNRDKPFDQFVREQIAGDLAGHNEEQLTATGFLVVGPKVLADRDKEKRRMDVVDEQIDTVGRAFLAMTLGCARCHDHKFDPIPTQDYYALAGIFTSTRTLDGFKLGNPVVSGWMLRPLGPEGEKQLAAVRQHQAQLKALADQIKKVKAELAQHEDRATMRSPSRLVGIVVDNTEARLTGTWKASTYSRPYVGAGYIHDDKSGKGEKSATFTPKLPRAGQYEVFISYTAAQGRSTSTPVLIRHAGGETTVAVDQSKKPTVDGLFRSVGKFTFEAGERGSVTISNKGTTGYVIVDAVRFVPAGALAKDSEMAMGIPAEVKQKIAATREKLKKLEADEQALKARAPRPPELVMAVRDENEVGDIRINIRGNPHQLGPVVPRGVLSVAAREPRPKIAAGESGRRELAQWLASTENPLTARVLVNRVWAHLFGEGLVRTVDNFGAQGEKPSHPELLDTLATRFMAEGWSVKRLIREMVLSRTYGLASVPDEKLVRADPENRLLGRAHRRRLEAEVLRDAMLVVAGNLDRGMGGSSVAGLGEAAINNASRGGVSVDGIRRRSVYLPVIRNDLPPIFEVFDFADPDVSTGKRDTTTVPTQALYLLNSPFVISQARAAATRLLAEHSTAQARIQRLYRLALGRQPSAQEVENVLKFLAGQQQSRPAELEAWTSVCQAIFGCTEFRFVE